MTRPFTVLPFLLAMAIAVAAMPTNVIQVCYGEMGIEHTQPWRTTATAGVRRIGRTLMSRLRALTTGFRGHPLAMPACAVAVVLVAALMLPDQSHGAILAFPAMAAPANLKAVRQRDSDLKGQIAKTAKERADIGNLAIKEARALTAEERAAFLAKGTDLDGLKAQLAENEELLAAAEEQNEADRAYRGIVPDADTAVTEEAEAAAGLHNPRARVLDKPKMGAFGTFLQHVRNAGSPGGSVHSSLVVAAATGMNETVPSEGGFLVAQERATTIRERVYETGQLLSRVNHLPIGAGSNGLLLPAIDETSRADGSRFGGIRSYWTAEAGQKTESKPKFRIMDLKLKKLAALVYATDELLQDAVALEAWIMSHLPDELIFKVEDSIISGTGAGQPLGILNSGAAISVTRNTAGAIKFEDIVAMWSRLYAPSRKNAVWLVEQGAEAQLYQMSLAVGVGGIPVYMPAGGLASAPNSTLFGRPIITSEYGAALGTVGDIMLVDPTQYVMIDKGGVESAVSMHVRFVYDESVFRFVYRVDGQPEWNAALTPKSGGATTSPFVLLAT